MYISKVTLREGFDKKNEFWRLGSEYTLHQAIWDLFSDGPDRKRDFIYRLENIGKLPLIYAVSNRKPANSLWSIETKEYDPKIPCGARLGFILRGNPTVKREGKRHDVIMDYKKHRSNKPQNTSNSESVQNIGRKWIESRSEKYGFHIEQVRVDGYRQNSFVKKNSVTEIRYSTLDFNGIVSIIHSGLFQKTLFNGIGAEKGFGCGLMLVKKI